MDVGRVLVELVVLVVAARVAAEAAERLRQPAVLGEILAGILVGPAALGLVGDGDALHLLGELGLVLLLFEVGRQMDLAEMRRVGGASARVALIGIVAPFALAYPAMRAGGVDATAALFLAAAITATSVGITARVFGDLRALASPEARIVLGAAVADDVAGLIVLTVVAAVATGGSLDAASIAGITGAAVGFVVAATAIGSFVVPRLLDTVAARSRSDGTLMAAGIALALGFARLAQAARLAPIVGAFVAGLAAGRSRAADDLHRRLVPLGHFFIPIFFLSIGIRTDLAPFGDPGVLAAGGGLTVLAIAGKLAAGLGVRRGAASRLLVGAAMIPRGEVGLIFASIGLARGVLDARTYAVLIVVVLLTTVVTPPAMRRLVHGAARAEPRRQPAIEPRGGWLAVRDGEIELAAEPPAALAGRIALDAAVLASRHRAGAPLVRWLAESGTDPIPWDEPMRSAFATLLRDGGDRSWRLLVVGGVFARLLPDAAAAFGRQPRDPFDLDGATADEPSTLARLRAVRTRAEIAPVWDRLRRPDLVLFAAMTRAAFTGRDAAERARRCAARAGYDHAAASTVAFLTAERRLLPAAAARADVSEESVLEIASHVDTLDHAGGLLLLALAEETLEGWEEERARELHDLVAEALSRPEAARGARDLIELRHRQIAAAMPDVDPAVVHGHVRSAPRRYLLAQAPATAAAHIRMLIPPLGRFEARLRAEPAGRDEWLVHVVVTDRRGVLAAITGALAACGVSVADAQISTWRSGVAVDVFRVHASPLVDWDVVRRRIEAALTVSAGSDPAAIAGDVRVDNASSPWHSVVEVRAADRVGLLHRVATALARAGLEIHEATVTTREGIAVDSFLVTASGGRKLGPPEERALRDAFAGRAARRFPSLRRAPAAVEGSPA